MRSMVLAVAVLLGACSPTPKPGQPMPADRQPPTAAMTLVPRAPALRGEDLLVDVAMPVARGGVRIFVAWTDGDQGAGICHPELRGECLDIVATNTLDVVDTVSAPDGTGVVTIPLASDHPTDTLALQAIVRTRREVYLSPPLVVDVSDPGPVCDTAVGCGCPPGHDGPLCEDIDECLLGLDTCTAPRDTCVNTRGSHFCVDPARTLVYPDDRLEPAAQHLRVAAILVNGKGPFPPDRADWAASPARPWDLDWFAPEDVGTGVFSSPDGVAAFLEEASGSRLSVSGTVVRWQDDHAADRTAADLAANRDAYFMDAWGAIDPRQYDLFLLVGLADSGFDQRGWLISQNSVPDGLGRPLSGKGTVYLTNSAFFVDARQTRFDGWILPSVPWTHEILHSLGVSGHSQSLWCYPSAAAYDPFASPAADHAAASVMLSDACRQLAYGDPFSLMGERLWATHPSAASKGVLGWLAPGEQTVLDATAGPLDTTVRLFAHPAQGSTKPRAIQVDLPEIRIDTVDTAGTLTFDRLTLERRAPTGFEQVLSALGPGTRPFSDVASWYLETTYRWAGSAGGIYDLDHPIGTDGVLAYLDHSDPSIDTVYLLDAHPAAPGVLASAPSPKGHPGNAGKFASAALRQGETLSASNLPVTVEVVGSVVDTDGEVGFDLRIRSAP